MKKILTMLLCFLCMTGCKAENNSNIDIQKLNEELSHKIVFEDELTLYEGNIKNLYGIDFAKSSIVYVGSGATAEEFALLEFENTEETEKAYNLLNEYIEQRKESYQTYNPEEAKRLEQAILKKKDKIVLLCVSNDENALKIINEYL